MSNRRRPRLGFTLIELIVVLIIIATIAGLVITNVGFLGRTADMAATAKNQQDLANQIGMYFVLQKRMPQRFDSLLTTNSVANPGSHSVLRPVNAAGAVTSDPDQQAWGFPVAGSNGMFLSGEAQPNLFPLTLTNATNAELLRSFTRAGFGALMDHSSAVVNCNDSGVTLRSLGTTPVVVAGVLAGSNLANRVYPATAGTFPIGVGAVVAVGVGPSNSLIPTTALNAPVYPGCDGRYYGRYIAYFALYNNGERATLIGVSDSYGRFPTYSIQQFNESLPDNGRQG
jgi:prepilin-type N-terminal cleavage/methylation domain-containing protein